MSQTSPDDDAFASIEEQIRALKDHANFVSIDELRQLGPYRISRLLGKGGMGRVYLAVHDRLNREVALKVMLPQYLLVEEAFTRFEREARAASRLQHPGICQVYDIGQEHGLPYIAMQWIEGCTLAAHLELIRDATRAVTREGNMSAPTTKQGVSSLVAIAEQIARALHVAHLAGLVHRDIKPSNLMLRPDGAPVILDFGVARDAREVGHTLTQTGQLVGTLEDMSPEQVRGEALDGRSDVFSLGVTLFEALTGTRPFAGDSRSETSERILREPTPNPSARNRCIGRDLRVVLETALAKDAKHRYATAEDFAADLQRVRQHEPIAARRVWTIVRILRWGQRNRLAAALIASLSAAVVGLVLALAWALASSAAALRAKKEADTQADTVRSVTQLQGKMLASLEPARLGQQLLEGLSQPIAAAVGPCLEDQARSRVLRVLEQSLSARTADLARAVVEAIVEMASSEAAGQPPLLEATLRLQLTKTSLELGLFSRARSEAAAATTILQHEHGDAHADTLESRFLLGKALYCLDDLAGAETQTQAALAGLRALFGVGDPRTLVALNSAVLIASDQHRFDDAEALVRQTWEQQHLLLGADDRSTLCSLNNLGGGPLSRDDLAAAEQTFRAALDGRLRAFGAQDEDSINSALNLVDVLNKRGQSTAAFPLACTGLDAAKARFGDKHPETLRALSVWLAALPQDADWNKAEAAARALVVGRREILGPYHPKTRVALNGLGRILLRIGKMDEAVRIMRQVVDSARAGMRPDDPARMTFIANLATLLRRQEQLDEAESLYEEAWEASRSLPKLADAHALTWMTNAADLLHQRGKLDQAETMLREVVDKSIASLGLQRAESLQRVRKLVLILRQADQFAAGEELLEALLQQLAATSPEDTGARNELSAELAALRAAREASQRK